MTPANIACPIVPRLVPRSREQRETLNAFRRQGRADGRECAAKRAANQKRSCASIVIRNLRDAFKGGLRVLFNSVASSYGGSPLPFKEIDVETLLQTVS